MDESGLAGDCSELSQQRLRDDDSEMSSEVEEDEDVDGDNENKDGTKAKKPGARSVEARIRRKQRSKVRKKLNVARKKQEKLDKRPEHLRKPTFIGQNGSNLILQSLLSEPGLLRDEGGMKRLQAVYSKMNELLSNYKEFLPISYFSRLQEKVCSLFISHAIKYASLSDGSPVGVIHYQNSSDRFEILSTSEIMKLVDKRIENVSSEGMDRIYVKSGHLQVPSFCVTIQNSKAKKLERRKERLVKFRNICTELLHPTDDSRIESSCQFDDSIYVSESDIMQNIKFLELTKKPKRRQKKPEAAGSNKPETAGSNKPETAGSNKPCNETVQNVDIESTSDTHPKSEEVEQLQVLRAEDVSKMVLDMHFSKEQDSAPSTSIPLDKDTETVMTTSKTDDLQKKSLTDDEGHPLDASNLTLEKRIALKRKLKNFKRNARRMKSKNLATDNDKPAKQPRTDCIVAPEVEIIAESSLVGDACMDSVSKVPDDPLSPKLYPYLPDTNPNPARLERGGHYVCWFDSSDGAFCYRKLLRTTTVRHQPYHSFKSRKIDLNTVISPIIKIDFELLPDASNQFGARKGHLTRYLNFIAEMKRTCVANTLPPATNELPPWNPLYENLYIMEVILNQQCSAYSTSKILIWKYPARELSKIHLSIRSG